MTQAAQKPDEHSSATQAEIERLQQALSREHDLHRRALADFDIYRKRVQREWDSAAADVSLAGPCRLADGGAGHRWQWRGVWLVRQDKKGHVLDDVHIALVQAVERLSTWTHIFVYF